MTDLQLQIDAGLKKLTPHLREWAQAHLCQPIAIQALPNLDAAGPVELLQLTQDSGSEDSSYAVVYDQSAESFGLITRLTDGRMLYLGPHGDFDEAVANM